MRHRIGRRLGACAIFAGALAVISPAAALAAPGAANAVAEHGSHTTMVSPNLPHLPGFVAIPAYSGNSFYECLPANTHYCLQSNGTSSQVTISNVVANYSTWTSHTWGTYDGGTVISFENGHGNCLRENNSNAVVIANGGCLASDNDGKWVSKFNSMVGWTLFNYQDETDYMLVHGIVNEYKVWSAIPVSTDTYTWEAK